jgi:IS30 family transposase
MNYQHFTVEEREAIQLGLWQKESIRSIAERLGRSPSSVSREIKRNRPPERHRYTPRVAHERALTKRGSRGRTQRLKSDRIRQYVTIHLKRRWSPEQIAGRIKRDLNESVSHEAIYQFIYAQVCRDGHGFLKVGATDFRPYLRRRRKRRLPFGTRRCQRVLQPKGPSIDTRPAVVDRRSRVGDWEGDTVESCQHKPGINTVVERKSGLVFMTHLANKTTAATIGALTQRFQSLPSAVKHTLTLDNGFENGNWTGIEAATHLTCYFAHAYHSWERGTNENTNGLIRDYFPKKTDFTTIPTSELVYVERELNSRPRKRLGYLTPNEVFSVALRG